MNKKSLLSLGVLALVLVLGVGYAVVSAVDLTFGGTATVKTSEIKVDIESVSSTSTATPASTVENTLVEHGTTDSFTITDMVLEEEVTLTYTIKNHETDVDATLAESVALTNSNSEYFSASYILSDNTLAAGDTTTVIVKVKLNKTPVDSQYNSTTIGFKINATAIDNHQ